MAKKVRLFVHDGIDQMLVASNGGQYASNGMFMLRQPPLARSGEIDLSSGSAVLSDAALSVSPNARILRIECDPGLVVGFEISPPGINDGVPVTADEGSMRLAGSDNLPFGRGYRISLIDMTPE